MTSYCKTDKIVTNSEKRVTLEYLTGSDLDVIGEIDWFPIDRNYETWVRDKCENIVVRVIKRQSKLVHAISEWNYLGNEYLRNWE